MRFREADVVLAVRAYYQAAGYDTAPEFPLLGRVADVFAVRSGATETVAIECKEKNWRRALQQAVRYRPAADHVFVALPASAVTANLTKAAASVGIGILGVSSDADVMVLTPGTQSEFLMPVLRNRALDHFALRKAGAE